MYDELTKTDIKKMEEEIEYRILVERPKLLEEVKRTREFGDLSENFEYKEAKRKKNKNESRIRYLKNMIRTAKIVEESSDDGSVGLYDVVECFIPDIDMEMTVRLVTTVRNDATKGFISKKSPFGRAIFGKREGDEVIVPSPDGDYIVQIRRITKSSDDDTAKITEY